MTSTFRGETGLGPGRSARTARTRTARQFGFISLLAVVSLVGTMAASTGAAKSAGAAQSEASRPVADDRAALNRIAIPEFDPATWKPTAETPLPTMESPIVFKTKDDAAYWYDTELKDVESILRTRSLAVGVGPTTIKVIMQAPDVETAHTFTSIVWPEGAANMPFDTPGPVQDDFTVDLVDPGLYVWNCTIHPLAAVVGAVGGLPGADGRLLPSSR